MPKQYIFDRSRSSIELYFRSLVAMSLKYEKAGKVDPLFDFVQSTIRQRRMEKKLAKKVSYSRYISVRGCVMLMSRNLFLSVVHR